MEDFELTPETAHPRAKELFDEDFYWDMEEESSPFGNDDGYEALHGFINWRKKNKNQSPVRYLQHLLASWEYPAFDLRELNPKKIEKFLSLKIEKEHDGFDFSSGDMMDFIKEMAKDADQEFEAAAFDKMIQSGSSMTGENILTSYDNAIIAVGFAQFATEGNMDKDIKELTKIAIKRELMPLMLQFWDGGYKEVRSNQLSKMLQKVDQL
ncbi:MAG: hypothetical protein ACK40G_09090 [Cytophagaceae bacterium]